MAVDATSLRLGKPQRLAGRDPQRGGDEVAARHEFGDGMLHLEPRVHLHEAELAVLVEQELAGPGAHVADRACQGQRRCPEPIPDGVADTRRWSLLEDLLVAPLDRTIALAEVNTVAGRIEQHLDLDMPGPFDQALQDQAVAPEGRGRFSTSGV